MNATEEMLNHEWMRDIARAKADPVFAAIEAFKPYGDTLLAAYAVQDDGLVATASAPAFDRLRDIYQMQPQTPAGLLAVMDLMVEWDGDHLRLTEEARRSRAGDGELDNAEWGLVAVFRHAKRMLEQMS